MSQKELSKAFMYQTIMNRKFGWRECTLSERLKSLGKSEMPLPNVYKLLNVKATKRGITFFCWFANDEVIEVMVNEYACDAYDVTGVWKELLRR